MLHVSKMRYYKQIKKEHKLYFWSFIKRSWLRSSHGFWQSVVTITLLLVPRKLLQRFSFVFPVFWFPTVESSQKSNWTWCLDIFPRNICSAVPNTIWVTNYTTRFGTKNVQKTKFEAAEMILDPWNQLLWELFQHMLATKRKVGSLEDCCLYKPTTILSSLVTTIFYSINHVLQSFKIDVFYLQEKQHVDKETC